MARSEGAVVDGRFWIACLAASWASAPFARAEDAGKRDFPATLVAEEPQVETEIAPQIAGSRTAGARRTNTNSDLAVQLTRAFGLIVNPNYTFLRPGGQGFQALEVGAKYQFVANAEHEIVFSTAIVTNLGAVGSRTVDAETYTSIVPTIFYGKGAGDLPDSFAWARPFAVTGQAGYGIPTRSHSRGDDPDGNGYDANPYVLSLEGSLQYSLPYLSENVLSSELPKSLAGLVPLVEYDIEVPVANFGGVRPPTFGTINPGFLWIVEGTDITWGLEALIPINRASGTHPGVRLQLSYTFKTPWKLAGRIPY